MVPNIQEWATEYLMDGAGSWDLKKWEDLKAEFIITLILPCNTTLSVDTLEELHRYTQTAMLCVSFLESAELLGVEHLGGKSVLEEKKWLYRLILGEIKDCMTSLQTVFGHMFPGLVERARLALTLPYNYAHNDLYVIERVCHLPPIIH